MADRLSQTVLLASTPNDGSEVVTIPAGATNTARMKVEAVGNIFFDISDTNFTITGNPALTLNTAVSRKTHGAAGDFDIDLPLVGTPGVECRSANPGHTLVFTFTNNVVSGGASVTSGTGSVSGSPTFAGNTMTVNLTGVTDAQTVGVTLSSVTDSFAQVLPSTVVNATFLLGDATGNATVNATDVSQVKLQSGALIGVGNFRSDLSANGSINAGDVSIAKSTSGHSVP